MKTELGADLLVSVGSTGAERIPYNYMQSCFRRVAQAVEDQEDPAREDPRALLLCDYLNYTADAIHPEQLQDERTYTKHIFSAWPYYKSINGRSVFKTVTSWR